MMEGFEQVEHDMSFSSNGRINVLLYYCNECRNKRNFELWMTTCESLLAESQGFMSKKPKKDQEKSEFEEHMEIRSRCRKALIKYNQYINNYHKNKDIIQFEPPTEIYDLLYEWEIMLRDKLQNVGILFKKADMSAF